MNFYIFGCYNLVQEFQQNTGGLYHAVLSVLFEFLEPRNPNDKRKSSYSLHFFFIKNNLNKNDK